LAPRVARDCARSWYGENEPGRGLWRVGGERVGPGLLHRPALVVVPRPDPIVPPSSPQPPAPRFRAPAAPRPPPAPVRPIARPPLGHVGMMAAARAPSMLWTPIAEWLQAQLGMR